MKARFVVATALTLICFASNSLLCRAALASGSIDAASFTVVRIVSGAVALTAVAAARGARPGGGSWTSAIVLFAYAAAFSFAYRRIQAGTGALVLFTAVQATMIGWGIVRGSRPTPLQWVGIGVAMGGLAYLVAPGVTRPDTLGALLMACAGAAWGGYSVLGRGPDPVATNAENFLRSLPLALALLVVPLPRATTTTGIALAVASGAVASGLGYSLWYSVVPQLGSTRAAVVQLAVPVVAALGAIVVLDERMTARLVGSGAAVIAGIALVAFPRAARARDPARPQRRRDAAR